MPVTVDPSLTPLVSGPLDGQDYAYDLGDYGSPLVSGAATETPLVVQGAAGQTADLVRIEDSASANLVSVGPTGVLKFGSALDTNLYRSAANDLKTDDNFYVGGRVFSASFITAMNGTANQVDLGWNGTEASPAVMFGTDTNLYRSGPNTLKTDDALVVAGGLTTGQASGTVFNVRQQNAYFELSHAFGAIFGYNATDRSPPFFKVESANLLLSPAAGGSVVISTGSPRLKVVDTGGNPGLQVGTNGELSLNAAGQNVKALDLANKGYIGHQTGNALGSLLIPIEAAQIVLAIRGVASQTGDLQQWRTSDNTVQASIAGTDPADGETTMQLRRNVTGALSLQKVPTAVFAPHVLAFLPGVTCTNMPLAETEMDGHGHRFSYDLTNFVQYRLTTFATGTVEATAAIQAQYWDGDSWEALTAVTDVDKDVATPGTWTTIPADARGEKLIRFVTSGGDGAKDTRITATLQAR